MSLNLAFDLQLNDLYSAAGLAKVHHYFLLFVKDCNEPLYQNLQKAYQTPEKLDEPLVNQLIIDTAPLIEEFIAHLFNILPYLLEVQRLHNKLALLQTIKRQFVHKVALKKYETPLAVEHNHQDMASVFGDVFDDAKDELKCAQQIAVWLKAPEENVQNLEKAAIVSARLVYENEKNGIDSVLFSRPQKLDYNNLLNTALQKNNIFCAANLKPREGFHDPKAPYAKGYEMAQSAYCLHCHKLEKDSCSKGFYKQDTQTYLKNPLGLELFGCPLKQKISQMNLLLSKGNPLGGLITAMIDNPLLAATGHRICNDCAKACIFQKQSPVDVPSIETNLLETLLNLPWGVEIYSLLTRWNPLRFEAPLPKDATNKRVLVAGMGPAGFTLSHYLLNEGHVVVGVDGLKIEPLPPHLSGRSEEGKAIPFVAIENWQNLKHVFAKQAVTGFGGVMAYGITARYDKNYLHLIRMILERRSNFLLKGGIRYGGTLTQERAKTLGFDHIALCMGAGSPLYLDMPGKTAQGILYANDFLMTLHLNGPYRQQSLSVLQIRMPLVVIGGGLTAIDVATEAMAYYPIQVKKFKKRYDHLVKKHGKNAVEAKWSSLDQEIAAEFLEHAMHIETLEETRDDLAVQKYIQSLGGVTILYRSDIKDAQAYKLNHDEISHALKQGVYFATHHNPHSFCETQQGTLCGIQINQETEDEKIMPCNTAIVAIGVLPNDNKPLSKLTDVSVFGDMDPKYRGTVVKAMASAKEGYKQVDTCLRTIAAERSESPLVFLKRIDQHFITKVHSIHFLNPRCIELTLYAPHLMATFKPGQLYKLQTFETRAPTQFGVVLSTEGIPLHGIEVDKNKDLITFLIYEAGVSSALCQFLKPNDAIFLMGPSGQPYNIPYKKRILLIATHLHSAVLWDVGVRMREQGCHVTFVVSFKSAAERYKAKSIEAAADRVVWCYEQETTAAHRSCDFVFIGSIEEALVILQTALALPSVDEILIHGSNALNTTVIQAMKTVWSCLFRDKTPVYGSVNVPMQCMLHGVCGRCMQVYEKNGTTHVTYGCAQSTQEIHKADYDYLKKRMTINSVSEKINYRYLKG